METTQLNVKGACDIAYPVYVGANLLQNELPAFIAARGFADVVIVSNDTVAPLYGEGLKKRLNAHLISVPDGERYKTLDTVRGLYDSLLAHGADRGTLIVALGGGVIGDMAGFAAASFMRGISLIQVPTTLLSMVDASIGGKVGVDLPQGKNLVGAFKDPLAVFAGVDTLQTLDPDEFRSGMAEVVKAGLLADGELLELLAPDDSATMRYDDLTRLQTIIQRAMQVKIDIVGQDRLEGDIRAYLNLGHTFGHALEQVSGYSWRHGYGVAVGMVAALRLSARLGLCDETLPAQVEKWLIDLGLPVRYQGYDPEALWAAMQHDKKWQQGTARFVLLAGIGKPLVKKDVARAEVIAVMESLRE